MLSINIDPVFTQGYILVFFLSTEKAYVETNDMKIALQKFCSRSSFTLCIFLSVHPDPSLFPSFYLQVPQMISNKDPKQDQNGLEALISISL